MKTNRSVGMIFVVLSVVIMTLAVFSVSNNTIAATNISGSWEKVAQLNTVQLACVEFESTIVTFKDGVIYRDVGNACGPRSSVEKISAETLKINSAGNLEIHHPNGSVEVFIRMGDV